MDRRSPSREHLLAIYLRHHAAFSQGGLDLFERGARLQTEPSTRSELRRLAAEVADDRAALLDTLGALGVQRRRYQEWIVGWGETVARLKPNGTLVRRSPLSDVIELEALCVAVQAKRLGWVTLRRLSETDSRLNPDRLDALVQRALDQYDRIEVLRQEAVSRVLGDPTTTRPAPTG